MGELTVLTDTEPRVRCQTKSEPSNKASSKLERASVPYSQRTIRKIGQCRADRGRGDDGGPVQEWMETFGLDLVTTAARKIAAKMPVPTG